MKMSSLVVAAGLLLPSCAAAPRQIAITIDDLPVHAPYPPGVNSLEVNRQMVAALKAGGVPATTFVECRERHGSDDDGSARGLACGGLRFG